MKNELTLDRLKSLLSYDPETGEFSRIKGVRGFQAGSRVGTLHQASGYIYVGVDSKSYRAHRLAWFYMTGTWPKEVDHINGNRNDNRFENLRECTRSQNNANGKRRADNNSGHKGVSWVGRNCRWRAYIVKDGKQTHLGYFKDISNAISSRDEAMRNAFGEFARV